MLDLLYYLEFKLYKLWNYNKYVEFGTIRISYEQVFFDYKCDSDDGHSREDGTLFNKFSILKYIEIPMFDDTVYIDIGTNCYYLRTYRNWSISAQLELLKRALK